MNNNVHEKPLDVRKRNLNILRFVVIPLCFLIIVAAVIFFSVYPSVSAPTAKQENATEAALTNFSDDLGVSSTLQFTTKEMSRADLSKGSLVLVSNSVPWSFPTTDTLVNVYDNAIDSYQLSGTGLQLQKEAMEPFNEMMKSFHRITGFDQVMLSECYRTEAQQTAIYQQAVKQYGEEEAAKFVAKPGNSEYHTGYALAFSLFTKDGTVMDFTGTDDCEWLLRNCNRYGFVLRYPEGKSDITGYQNQPYHLRYVGKPHAYLMRLKDYCLEEYLEYVSHYTFGGSHIQVTDNENQKYEIYYVPAEEGTTNVPVPMEQEYTISGDNHNGFIVTVKL